MGDKYHHSVTSCQLSSRRGFLDSHRGEVAKQYYCVGATIGRQNK